MQRQLIPLALRVALRFWAVRVPSMARAGTLATLLQKIEPPSATPYAGLEALYIAKRVKRATRRPWVMRDRTCLREGLLAYRFLRLAGFKPALHFGLDRASVGKNHLSAHCWVVLDGQTILNPPTSDMLEILVHCGPDTSSARRLPGLYPDVCRTRPS